MTKVLTRLINKVIELGEFVGFKLNNNVEYRILQFADDIILLGKGLWQNLWIIKSVLRGFKMVTGLKVKFRKSKIYEIYVENSFM